MCDCMTFPDTVDEFMEKYKVVDTDGIYMSKGAELVPIFRMRQWFEHIPSAQPERKKGRWIYVKGHTAVNCSACYHCSWSLSFEDTVKRFNFCPACGADMREVSE